MRVLTSDLRALFLRRRVSAWRALLAAESAVFCGAASQTTEKVRRWNVLKEEHPTKKKA